MSVSCLHRAAIAAGFVGVAASAQAGGYGSPSYVRSATGVTAGNVYGGTIYTAYLPGGFVESFASETMTNQGAFDFTGLDREGATRTMSHAFQSSARSEIGVLRARITTDTINTIHNESNPLWIDDHSAGVPEYFNAQSYASFYDEVQIGAAAPVASVTVAMRVTGSLHEPAPGAYTTIAVWREMGNGGFLYLEGFANSPGEGDRVVDEIVRYTFEVNNGTAPIGFGLQTFVASYLFDAEVPDGATFQLTSDAFNTMQISRIVARDFDGNVVQIESLMGSSGVDYTPFIPAPGAVALFGAAGLVAARRRR